MGDITISPDRLGRMVVRLVTWLLLLVGGWWVWKHDPGGLLASTAKFTYDLIAQVIFSSIGLAVSIVVIYITTQVPLLRAVVFPFLDELQLASQIWRASVGARLEARVLRRAGIDDIDNFRRHYQDYKFGVGEGILLAGKAAVTGLVGLGMFLLIGNFGTPLG